MTGGKTSGVSVGLGPQQILGAAYTRKAIIFHPPNAGRVTISTDPNPVLDQGPTLQAGQGPLKYDEDGEWSLVPKPWYGIASAAGTFIGFTEIFGS